MKKQAVTFISILAIILGTGSCSREEMDRIDTNPNNPTDVPIILLIPSVTIGVPYMVSGTDLAWYSSIFAEHTAGVNGSMESADKRANLSSQLSENLWSISIYPGILPDLKLIIDKGSEGGNEAGNWHSVGVAQVLFAYTMLVMTDAFGRIPYSEALQGSENRKPRFDNQEFIYTEMLAMLDMAILNFQKESTGSPGPEDFIFGGDLDLWTKLAYSLKARHLNRLSNVNGASSYDDALEAASMGFERDEGFIFDNYAGSERNRNPWFRVQALRDHHAISRTIYNIMNDLNDPRIPLWFTQLQGSYNPAQNGSASDPTGFFYSRISSNILYDVAPLPIMTYDELKFIEAECQLRKSVPDKVKALAAYREALDAALVRAGVNQAAIDAYRSNPDVLPANADDLTLDHIITQKYISLWPYGSIEAWSEWRRTGIPSMTNTRGETPRRLPYPQNEISGNADNVPDVSVYNGVWWDDGDED